MNDLIHFNSFCMNIICVYNQTRVKSVKLLSISRIFLGKIVCFNSYFYTQIRLRNGSLEEERGGISVTFYYYL